MYRTETMNLGKAISGLHSRIKQVDGILYRFHQKENENYSAWRRAELNGYPQCMVDVAHQVSREIDEMYKQYDIISLRREFGRLNVLYDNLIAKYDSMLRTDVRRFFNK